MKYKRTFYYVDFVSNFFSFIVQVSKASVATKLKKLLEEKMIVGTCVIVIPDVMFSFFF